MSGPWCPPDASVPSLARVWDDLLRGKNAFQVDRDAVDELLDEFPGWRELALMQRRFVGRAVDHLVGDLGVRQLIDLGCGFPSPRLMNVHEIAVLTDEDARVLYVDQDPCVVAHARALLAGHGTAAIQADVTDPATILRDEVTRRLLDLDQPYAVLLCGVLHHLADEQLPVRIVDELKAAMPPGSYLVVSTLLGGDDPGDHPLAEEAERAWDKVMRVPARFRTWAEQMPYLAGLDLVEPGLVYADDWHPDKPMPARETPEHTLLCAGIGRNPGRPS